MSREWWQSPERYRWEAAFWSLMSAVIVALAFFFAQLWAVISIVYVAFVSNYALTLTARSAQQAAKAAREAAGAAQDSADSVEGGQREEQLDAVLGRIERAMRSANPYGSSVYALQQITEALEDWPQR